MKLPIIILAALATLLCVSGCGQRPRVDVKPVIENGQVAFEIPWKGANGLLGFTVKDETGTNLWDVDLSYEKGHKIIYGVLPTGGNMDPSQRVPEDGSKPPDNKGKKVQVQVEYQYDSPYPSSGSFAKTVEVPER